MKKIIFFLLSTLLLQSAFTQSVFTKKESALKYIKGAFEMAFDKGPLTHTDPNDYGKFVFRYEINGEKLLVVKNTLEGKPGDSFYAYIWFEVPLDELVVVNKNNSKYKNTTNLTLTGTDGKINYGYSNEGIHQPKLWYKHDGFHVPLKYTTIKDGLANLTAAFRFLNDERKKNSKISKIDEDPMAFASGVKMEDIVALMESHKKDSEVKKEYYGTGELKSEARMKGDKKEGIKRNYYKSGKLESSTTYKNDRENGPYEYYFENGQLRQSCNYTNGRFDGYLKEYFSNGVLKNESLNIAGKYQGYVKRYSETGKLIDNKYYIKGQISGTMTECEGAAYFLRLLKQGKDDLLEDKQIMRQEGQNIKGFYYEYFSEGSAILSRPSHCRLDYIDKPTTEKGWLEIYNSTRSALLQCGNLKADREHVEKNSTGQLRTQTFWVDDTYFIKIELQLAYRENLTIYVSRKEKS